MSKRERARHAKVLLDHTDDMMENNDRLQSSEKT